MNTYGAVFTHTLVLTSERTETHKRACATNSVARNECGRGSSRDQLVGNVSITTAYEKTSTISR